MFITRNPHCSGDAYTHPPDVRFTPEPHAGRRKAMAGTLIPIRLMYGSPPLQWGSCAVSTIAHQKPIGGVSDDYGAVEPDSAHFALKAKGH